MICQSMMCWWELKLWRGSTNNELRKAMNDPCCINISLPFAQPQVTRSTYSILDILISLTTISALSVRSVTQSTISARLHRQGKPAFFESARLHDLTSLPTPTKQAWHTHTHTRPHRKQSTPLLPFHNGAPALQSPYASNIRRENATMDTKMDIDMGKIPEANQLSPLSEQASIPTLDGWIESLMTCKQLAEADVTRLCDRVSRNIILNIIFALSFIITKVARRHERYYRTSRMFRQW